MLGKSLGFLTSQIPTMSSSAQSSEWSLRGQSNQNPLNMLSHTSSSSYPIFNHAQSKGL